MKRDCEHVRASRCCNRMVSSMLRVMSDDKRKDKTFTDKSDLKTCK
jgi:hypothetical protein